nr:MAG TPA: protein of unknown function (DUF3870) [Caudoviricetes sp.]
MLVSCLYSTLHQYLLIYLEIVDCSCTFAT